MMSSRVLSRLLPVAEGDVSVFEGMRGEPRQHTDVEAQSESNPEELFRDQEERPEQLLFDGTNYQDALRSPETRPSSHTSPVLGRLRPRWLDDQRNRRLDEDEDVPESLLLESRAKAGEPSRPSSHTAQEARADADAQWRATQEQHKLHQAQPFRSSERGVFSVRPADMPSTAQPDPRSDAMWLFTNATNLDAFLLDVYQYYAQHGIWSILLARAIGSVTEIFIFSFAMFLTTCIDYSLVPVSKSTAEVMIPQCMSKASWLKNAAVFFFVIYICWQMMQNVRDLRRLFRMRDFYEHVLGISDQDIQTVSWVRVVDGLVKVQNANVATAEANPRTKNFLGYQKPRQRLNAESIANRLMRRDNFYVAIYNKEVFDFTLPLPFVGSRQFYSKSLEWCIDFCLTNFIFDEQGNIRPFCLDVRNRRTLVDTLRRRLQFAALTSVLIAPFNIVRFCLMYFFRYYTEFTRNPSRASARSFTPFAEWKIREFNELEHLFQRRLRQAYPFANDYLKQFPKDKTDQACRLIALVSGGIAGVLGLFTLWDSELFLGFEVTPGRTAVFWFTVMVGIFGVAHGALPDENEVHDPVLHLKEVLMFTHYMPAHWKDRLHSNEVRAEFSAMYQLRILIFVEEILSLIVAPWILLRNATLRSERIVDFFREQTVHVDGIGHQCNFAVFGFKKDLNAEDPTAVLNEPDGLRDDYFGLKDDKMAASVQNFMQYYSHYNHRQGVRRTAGWQPPPAWPPVMSSAAAIYEEGATTARASSTPRPATAKPSDQRQLRRTPPSLRPSKHAAHRAQRDHHRTTSHQPSEASGADAKVGERESPTSVHEQHRGVSESRLMAQDSDLQDYNAAPARYGDNDLDSDTDGEGRDGGTGQQGAGAGGVLGMLYQFSKAQTEKGTGVQI